MARHQQRQYSKEELVRLLKQAVSYNHGRTPNRCKVLYRNRRKEWFDDIIRRGGLMTCYVKDGGRDVPSGDPRSPINSRDNVTQTGIPKGLFFLANTNLSGTGLPPRSPYGDTRLMIPIPAMLDATTDRLFFADFYCCRPDSCHYVTLLATKPESYSSMWCEQNLIELKTINKIFACQGAKPELEKRYEASISQKQMYENPFFYFEPLAEAWTVSSRVWVEIMYTEDIDISAKNQRRQQMAWQTMSPAECGKHTNPNPKNKQCRICNLN